MYVMSMESGAQKLLLAAFLNYASLAFTSAGDEFKGVLEKLMQIARVLRPEIVPQLERALNASIEDPNIVYEVSSRIELGGISPYASDYVKGADKVYIKSEVSGLYRSHGVKVRGEMPDHIAPMLQLVSFLKVKEAHLEAKGDLKGVQACRETVKLVKEAYLKPTIEGLLDSIRRYSEKAPHLAVLEAVSIVLEHC